MRKKIESAYKNTKRFYLMIVRDKRLIAHC